MPKPQSTTQPSPAHPAHPAHPARVPKSKPGYRHQPQAPPRAHPAPSISRHRLLHDATVISLGVAASVLVAPHAQAIGTHQSDRPPRRPTLFISTFPSHPAPVPSRPLPSPPVPSPHRVHAGFKKDLSKARRNSGLTKADYLDLDISQYNVTETVATAPPSPAGDTTQTPETTTDTTTKRPINTLKYYDMVEGTRSPPVVAGDTVTVHFDCIFRKIDAVSTRSARLLGANRVLAEPFSFSAASKLDAPRAITTEAGGGLFTGQSGPKPPQALSYAVVGMKVGGKRSVFVPAALGYGAKGEQEIPPNCPEFELQIELLSIGTESS